MSDRLTPQQFQDEAADDGWRVLAFGACAYFPTESFSQGAALVAGIASVVDKASLTPHVDLRPWGVTVRLFDRERQWLTAAGLDLASRIAAVASELGLNPDPTVVQDVDFTIDAPVLAEVMPFWGAVLGYEQVTDDDLIDPMLRWPSIWFQEKDRDMPEHNRIHIDVWVPHDVAEERVRTAVAAGGRVIGDRGAPMYWSLADSQGNVVDVATWQGRD